MEKIKKIRLEVVREGEVLYEKPVGDSHAGYSVFKFLENLDREEFWVLGLDVQHRPVYTEMVSRGSLTWSVVNPREIFKGLILGNCRAFIAAHNHPSGDPAPSSEDKALTKRLSDCGDFMGIYLVDHIVVGHNKYFSFDDKRML